MDSAKDITTSLGIFDPQKNGKDGKNYSNEPKLNSFALKKNSSQVGTVLGKVTERESQPGKNGSQLMEPTQNELPMMIAVS